LSILIYRTCTRHDIVEILLKLALSTKDSINKFNMNSLFPSLAMVIMTS